MIVTCPECASRYKIDESKIKGRGAKITCPNCAHKFVVYREGESAETADAPATSPTSGVPSDVARRDFREVGITWKVRKGIGLTYDFSDLAKLREYIEDGQVDERDVLSYDQREWVPIDSIKDLDGYFWDVWQRAVRGEIAPQQTFDQEEDDEDASDAPTGFQMASDSPSAYRICTARCRIRPIRPDATLL